MKLYMAINDYRELSRRLAELEQQRDQPRARVEDLHEALAKAEVRSRAKLLHA